MTRARGCPSGVVDNTVTAWLDSWIQFRKKRSVHFLSNPTDQAKNCVVRREEAGEKKLTRGLLLLGHQEKQPPRLRFMTRLWIRLSKPPWCECANSPREKIFNQPSSVRLLFSATGRPERERKVGETSRSGRKEEVAISLRWMAVIQKHGKNYNPDLVCHKENYPSDKIGVPGCHKKWSEHNTNWSR